METQRAGHYVYLYRSSGGVPKYVGYGRDVARALSHAVLSHNEGLRRWLESSKFELSVAGPYRDAVEAKCVEAAIIATLSPEFNVAPGEGPRFVPLGVPPELSERQSLPPLSPSELGTMCGGALIVFLSAGDMLKDGRTKFDPAHPDDAVVRSNIEGNWDIGRHRESWTSIPRNAPAVLLGVHGKPTHRFVAGAALIDQRRWFDDDLYFGVVGGSKRWKVPLVEPVNLDALDLRGRRVADVKFGQLSWQLHQWIDSEGETQHPSA